MRKIIHIDMDCFYAAVEMRDNPELADKPIAVGGRLARSVVATCNYQARAYGVRSAMPVSKALKLCPQLVLVPGRMDVYKAVSKKISEIFSRYTDKIEPLSLDEAFLDVSDCQQCSGSATLIAEKIRSEIHNELNLTASAGVAPNKFLAKVASDENKPNGQCVIPPDKVSDFVENLPLKKIPGVGPKTMARLQAKGFYTCADVRSSNLTTMQKYFGKFGPSLFNLSFGKDEREVVSTRVRKSLAIETTLMEDIETEEQCLEVIDNLLPKFEQRLEKVRNLKVIKQGIKIKFADFTQTTVENSQKGVDNQLFAKLLPQALARGEGKKVRLIGISVGFAELEDSLNKIENNDDSDNQLHEPQLSFDLGFDLNLDENN
ncbi:DNA polymerase IV [Thalassotalea crassostreae]|uniref:DNA polymerase IV n=1 Tax=Thalassotalea crassostreae TaxID=1763536 RepID=UPI0009EEDC86|nr:DNA polymerase IV [Thalassotalea crassostreae]